MLFVGLDGAIGRWIGNAGQDVALGHLVLVEEILLRVVDRSRNDFANAGAACSRSARIRQVDASLLGSINQVRIIGALNLLLAIGRDQGNGVGRHHLHVSLPAGNRELRIEVVSHWRRGCGSIGFNCEALGRWHAASEHRCCTSSHFSLTRHALNIWDYSG